MKYLANIVTSIRIVCSLLLLMFPVFSSGFYTIYILAGLSDIVDGTVARKTGSSSEFGSRLDTIADFTFVAAGIYKLIPVLYVDNWLWVWIGCIAVVKLMNVILGYTVYKKLVAEHTFFNKLTGFLLFMLPFSIKFFSVEYSTIIVCCPAAFASIQEGYYIRIGRMLD